MALFLVAIIILAVDISPVVAALCLALLYGLSWVYDHGHP